MERGKESMWRKERKKLPKRRTKIGEIKLGGRRKWRRRIMSVGGEKEGRKGGRGGGGVKRLYKEEEAEEGKENEM